MSISDVYKRKAKGQASFHTPGHKGEASPLCALGDLLKLDLTELPDTDSLFEASGAIEEAQRAASELFGTKRTLFSAGGCTLAMQAMIGLAAGAGGKMIAGRNIHRAAVNAMALLGITPVWVQPRPDAGEGLPGRVPVSYTHLAGQYSDEKSFCWHDVWNDPASLQSLL